MNWEERREKERLEKLEFKRKARKWILISILIFVGVFGFFYGVASFRIIEEGTVGVVRRFGVIERKITQGPNMVWGIVNNVQRYDLRVRELGFELRTYSIDAQPAHVVVVVPFNLNPAYVMYVAREFGSQEMLESIVDGVFVQEIQNVFAEKTAMETIQYRAYISLELNRRLREVLAPFHILVRNVQVEQIDFEPQFMQVINDRIAADARIEQVESEKEQAVIRAQQDRIVAQEEADAEAYTIMALATAEAEAIRLVQTALSEIPEENQQLILMQMFIERWNGVLPQIMGGDGGLSMILDGFVAQPPPRPAPVAPAY